VRQQLLPIRGNGLLCKQLLVSYEKNALAAVMKLRTSFIDSTYKIIDFVLGLYLFKNSKTFL